MTSMSIKLNMFKMRLLTLSKVRKSVSKLLKCTIRYQVFKKSFKMSLLTYSHLYKKCKM